MKKQFYFLFFLLLLISCNKDCPETFYGIRLGRDSRGEFLKAREKGYIRMNSDGKSLLNITSNIKAKIDYWAEHDINEEGRLTQIDLNFYDGYVIKNSEYLLSGKKSQNVIVKFFEDKYGVSWQITPEDMAELILLPGAYKRMMNMKKLDIEELKNNEKTEK